MQPEIPLPISQDPDTGTYTETSALLRADKFILFLLIYFNIVLQFMCRYFKWQV
jgi:hypothetical protein